MGQVIPLLNTLDNYQKQIKRTQCTCGYDSLKNLPIEYYPHDGGWLVQNFKEKQWLFVTCPRCEYQWALWKLGVERN